MKFVFLVISILLLAIGILGITNLTPTLFFPNAEFSFTFLLLFLVVLGLVYGFANPLLMVYERFIIIILMAVILLTAIHPLVSSVLTIKLNITNFTRALVTIIVSVIGGIYSIFAPG